MSAERQGAPLDAAAVLATLEPVLDLLEYEHRRRWQLKPLVDVLVFGAGQPAVQVLHGDKRTTFAGLAIANASARAVNFDTSQRNGAGGMAMHCPAKSMLVWPVPFNELTLAIAAAEGAEEEVVVMRLWVPPPAPAVYAYA